MVFVSPRYQYVDYYSSAVGTEQAHQEAEMLVEHIAYFLMIRRCIKKAMRYSDMSMKLLYRQATIHEHAMEYRNVQKIVFESDKMVRGEGLVVLEERIKTMDPDENEIYKFLG